MKNTFLQGTLILLGTSVLLRGIGFVYQMAVVRYAGTESVGLFNMSFPFYIIFVVLSTAGLPVAMAKIIAQYVSQGKEDQIVSVRKTAFRLVGGLSFINFVIAVFFMPQLFHWFGTEERVVRCFRIWLPGILIVPLTSVMRGYFQGMQQMWYPSFGQIVEQLLRVGSGLILVLWFVPQDVVSMAEGLVAAAILGELGGCLFLGACYWWSRRRWPQSNGVRQSLWKPLLSLGLPTTITRFTSSVDMAIEASLVPACLLMVGYNSSQAAGMYGQFSGVAISLITIPTVLTNALSTALLPAISEADALCQRTLLEKRCRQSLQYTWMWGLPVLFVLYTYGEALGQVLFHVYGLGEMLRMLSFGAIFLYFGQTLVGILQGLGKTGIVCRNNFFGSAAKLVGMYYCIVFLRWGGIGIAGGMVLGYGLQCLLDLGAVIRYVRISLGWKELLSPVLGSSMMLGLIQWSWKQLGYVTEWNFLCACLIGGAGYLLVLCLLGQFSFFKNGE